jgi:hypothetical protein
MVYYKVSFKDLKSKLPKLKQDDYNTKYADLKKNCSSPPDPKIVFNDSAKTIEISYFGEDLLVYNKPLVAALKSAFPYGQGSTAQIIDQAFGASGVDARKAEVLDNSRGALRDLPYQEVPPNTPQPDPGKTTLENLKDIAASNPKGVSFGGGHGDATRNSVMDQLLADPGHGGMSLFFIEELGVLDQPLIDQFLSSPKGAPIPPELKNRVGLITGMEAMLAKMRDHNADNPGDTLKAYGINSAEAKSREGMLGLENRVAMMNSIAKDAIDGALKANPGKKFMAFVGAAHSNTHPGGVPGMSQIFGVPAIKLDDKGKLKLDEEDKSLRGMPSEAELKAIEKVAAKFEKDPAYAKMNQDQRLAQMQKFVTQARIETFKALDRDGKKAALQKSRTQGVPLSDEEMAEAIVLSAEDTVLQAYPQNDDKAGAEVKAKKHAELVLELTTQLKALSPDKKKNPNKLITELADSVAGGSALGFYKKDKDIKKGTAHVSINVASAKRTWVQQMARL